MKKYKPFIAHIKWFLLTRHGASSGCGRTCPPDTVSGCNKLQSQARQRTRLVAQLRALVRSSDCSPQGIDIIETLRRTLDFEVFSKIEIITYRNWLTEF